MKAVYQHEILAAVAKRLPIQALVKFAQVSAATNHAAREAWQTWEAGCTAAGTRRMFSDKCWMDAYARRLRQQAFRYIDASLNWSKLHDLPRGVATSLNACFSATLKMASLKFCVRNDFQVVNVLVMRRKHVWATISSTGECWQFTDALPILGAVECGEVASFLRTVQNFLHKSANSVTLPALLLTTAGGGGSEREKEEKCGRAEIVVKRSLRTSFITKKKKNVKAAPAAVPVYVFKKKMATKSVTFMKNKKSATNCPLVVLSSS
jgi:hypothetical protein